MWRENMEGFLVFFVIAFAFQFFQNWDREPTMGIGEARRIVRSWDTYNQNFTQAVILVSATDEISVDRLREMFQPEHLKI
jgi:hypothetical protein